MGETTGGAAGGSTLAAGSLHVAAFTGGARPIGTTIPIAAADAIHTETIRRIADMSHLSSGPDVAFDIRGC